MLRRGISKPCNKKDNPKTMLCHQDDQCSYSSQGVLPCVARPNFSQFHQIMICAALAIAPSLCATTSLAPSCQRSCRLSTRATCPCIPPDP